MTSKSDETTSPLPYVVPMVAFLMLTAIEGFLPKVEGSLHPVGYPIGYTVKIVVVVVLCWLCRSAWRDLKPWPRGAALVMAVALGVLVTVLWVGLDGLYPEFAVLG